MAADAKDVMAQNGAGPQEAAQVVTQRALQLLGTAMDVLPAGLGNPCVCVFSCWQSPTAKANKQML